MGYVQSDEISLVWDGRQTDKLEERLRDLTGGPGINDAHFFAGKIQKSCSVLASMSAASFAVALQDNFGSLGRACPHFDCRVLQIPSQVEAANMMLWRSLDARKNSISMLARHYFSHKELMNKSGKEMIAMMAERGVSLDQHPAAFTRGTWIQRNAVSRFLTAEELAAIPEQHRPDPLLPVVRSSVDVIDMPPFVEVTNRVDVVFSGAKPEV
jgi:tRNA(His) 5'-end guanylyltransferase